ncbi:hypothetical protein [Mucilaginibacter endophyticus]|uniref:hypothetical protein n=1 Tax=Mucilaginibacter endophyticus TaxID=2675003 RepID=UPI000E0DBC26|nr:hypothetical protein [Mucilaginibacter endophyticus]
MGLPVNIASRIQGETKILNNNLLVSEEAFSMLADEDLTHESFSVMLRGVSNPVKLHLLGNPYEKAPPVAPAEDQLPYHMAVAG